VGVRSCLVATLSTCLFAAVGYAAPYKFTLTGPVTYSFFSPAIVGEPFEIEFTADSEDHAPDDPEAGIYTCSAPTVRFLKSNTSLIFNPVQELRLYVTTGGLDIIQYQCVSGTYTITVGLVFYDGTLTSDALPMTLPLQQAYVAHFFATPILTDTVRGNVTGYHATPIPEGSSLLPLLLVLQIFRRGRIVSRA
jgi:hypothetical protein